MKNEAKLRRDIVGKRILYIATKNSDYIRLSQEIDMIEELGERNKIIAFPNKTYFWRILKVYVKLLTTSMKNYDIVVIGFMAQMILPIFWWKFRKNVIFTDFFVSIYDTLVFDRKKVKEKSLLARICKWIDARTIKKSTYLIVDTKTHGEYFSEEFKIESDKIYVYYLKADKNIYYPRTAKKPVQYGDKYIVLYFGSILPVQGVEIVMDAIRNLADINDIHFIVIGPIGNKISKATTNNVTYIDWLPQKELAEYIAFSDLCLAGHFSDTVNKAKRTIPGKAYIYRAMKKRIILGDSPANRELAWDDGSFVSMGNAQMLAQAILKEYEEMRVSL